MTANWDMPIEETGAQAIESGSFASPARGEDLSNKSRLVIATFNIRYGVGAFLITGSFLRRAGLSLPRRRASLVARHLKMAADAFSNNAMMPPADIIALQEADNGTRRAGGHDIAREIAVSLEMNYARAAMIALPDAVPKPKQWYLDFEERIAPDEAGDTGVAILSRLPFARVARIDLPFYECAWRPRLALGATIERDGRRIHLFNAHIDPHATLVGQRAQHEKVLEQAGEMSEGDEATILLGDFNTLTPKSRVETRGFLESRGYQTVIPNGTPTWRAGLFRNHTDWIFTRGVRVSRWGVARPLGVSDHWPVWVEIDMRGDEVYE